MFQLSPPRLLSSNLSPRTPMKLALITALGLGLSACQKDALQATDTPSDLGTRNVSDTERPKELFDRSAPGRSELPAVPAAYFFDGDRRQDLYLTASLVAEFEPSQASVQRLHALRPEAREVEQTQSGVRLWSVEADSMEAAHDLDAAGGQGSFSPVFHEGAGEYAGRCALSGGVIVRFPRGTSDEQISTFLAEQGLNGTRIGNLGTTWSIEGEPGMASLELANRLHEMEATEYATPNLWREVTTR